MSAPDAPSQPCADWDGLLSAYLDGELDAAHGAAVERHLAACPACAAALARMAEVRRRVAREAVRWSVPEGVRQRVLSALAAEAEPPRRAGLAARLHGWLASPGGWSFLPSLAVLAAALLMILLPRGAPEPGREPVVSQLIASHVRSQLADHLTDVPSSDRHTVKPWFGGKIDFSPQVVDLSARGFPLAGGRLDYVGGRVVAALVYRRNGHVINVFAWPSGAPARPARARDGYNVANWTEAGLTYWAVSDLNTVELKEFQEDFVEALPR